MMAIGMDCHGMTGMQSMPMSLSDACGRTSEHKFNTVGSSSTLPS